MVQLFVNLQSGLIQLIIVDVAAWCETEYDILLLFKLLRLDFFSV